MAWIFAPLPRRYSIVRCVSARPRALTSPFCPDDAMRPLGHSAPAWPRDVLTTAEAKLAAFDFIWPAVSRVM